MRSIPYGYKVMNGRAVIDQVEGKKVRDAFQMYAAGSSLAGIKQALEINRYHAGIDNILKDRKYLGTEFYPPLIDQELFDQVQKARQKRKEAYAKPQRKRKDAIVQTQFTLKPVKKHLKDPFAQAQYVYQLIKEKGDS